MDSSAYVENEGLLAKWRLDNGVWARGRTINGHLQEVMGALDFFFSEPYHKYASFGEGLYDVMHLHRFLTFEEFKCWCELATLGHDLGKCSGEFQAMLWDMEHVYRENLQKGKDPTESALVANKSPRHKQAYRHEFLSAVLLWSHPEIRTWFLNQAGSDRGLSYVLAGAFGHHLKADFDKAIHADVFLSYQPKPVYLNALSKGLDILVQKRKLPSFPLLQDWSATHPLLASEKTLKDALRSIESDPFFHEVDDDAVSAAIKWVVILADIFGSISVEGQSTAETRKKLYGGLREMFKTPDINYKRRIIDRIYATAAESSKKGVEARASGTEGLSEEDVAELLGGALRPMQERCDVPTSNLIVTASTGGGKTVAGLVWANPDTRLIFTTPTTDTGTRLFFDYANGDEDTIRHSRSWMDMPAICVATPDSATESQKQEQLDLHEAMHTLEQFGFNRGITFTTADQILGLVAYYRKSVMWLLHIVSSQVVFDEFHSYDATMQAWYLRFLDWFPGIRSAHLSATVPQYYQDRLVKVLNASGRQTVHVSDPAGPDTPRSAKRYHFHIVSEDVASSKFGPGVLWLTNTVKRCQFAGHSHKKALLYHSRFRYRDRRTIRDRVIDIFRKKEQIGVISTQVAEMSLDISAKAMITEICPPASLIQRLGRVNRTEIPTSVADVYIYMPSLDNGLPYSTKRNSYMDDYMAWMLFADDLSGRDISQDDLDLAFQAFYAKPVNQPNVKNVYTSKLKTIRRNVRSGSITTQCLLQSDCDQKPQMTVGQAKWYSVPAILEESDRAILRAGSNCVQRHYVLNDKTGTWVYDSRLGLMDRKTMNGLSFR